jgi:hypothetical protein
MLFTSCLFPVNMSYFFVVCFIMTLNITQFANTDIRDIALNLWKEVFLFPDFVCVCNNILCYKTPAAIYL